MKSALFFRFEENLRPVSRFWELWRSKMRFGQNVLRMTWNDRFCMILMERVLFSRFCKNFRPVWQFWELWRSKMRFGQNVPRVTWNGVLYNFYEKRTVFQFWNVFPFWREFESSLTILRTSTLKNAIWPKRAADDLKRVFCRIFIKSARFFLFKRIARQCDDFVDSDGQNCDFGQNVLRMAWKERFVQFSWKAHCFPVLNKIWGQFHDFEYFDPQKCDLAKTCSAWPEKSVLYNFHRKRTFLPFCIEFGASVTILRTLMLKNAIWAKRASHDLKKAFFTLFMKSALFSRFEENFRLVSRFWKLWRSKMRFGRNVLRMTWNDRFVWFWWKGYCFPVFARISGHCDDFDNFWRSKMRFVQNVLRLTWKERFVQFS